jgi:hypothetical protein
MIYPRRKLHREAARSARRRQMPRDDWKYDEDMWEDEEGEKKKASPEKQCARCLHWIPRESPSCNWCGKVFEDRDGS